VDPVKKIVEKCNLCAPFVARGEQPACVATCPAECRVFGDLDDPGSAVSRAIREKGAKPLVTAEVNVGPKATYAGEAHREHILAAGAVKQPRKSWLTKTWGTTLPAARNFVPAIGLAFVGGGLLVNLKARADRVKNEEAGKRASSTAPAAPSQSRDRVLGRDKLGQGFPAAPSQSRDRVLGRDKLGQGFTAPTLATESLPRHRAGVRLLHWFNALSWLILVATGTGLMSAASFALFGAALPRSAARLLGGPAHLLRFHVLWGLLWAAVIVPMFLLFKKGPREVLAEVRLTRDDLAWLFTKPLAMAGFRKQPLPPQDKYNAGQKLFAILVLLATVLIIASGLVMTFHLGSADVVAGSMVVHELAIALALLGAAVHVTMAAVIAEERPALRSMITGRIDYLHAKHHSPKWVAELDARRSGPREGEKK
jgi:formate dehydrogenase gamma subunit